MQDVLNDLLGKVELFSDGHDSFLINSNSPNQNIFDPLAQAESDVKLNGSLKFDCQQVPGVITTEFLPPDDEMI